MNNHNTAERLNNIVAFILWLCTTILLTFFYIKVSDGLGTGPALLILNSLIAFWLCRKFLELRGSSALKRSTTAGSVAAFFTSIICVFIIIICDLFFSSYEFYFESLRSVLNAIFLLSIGLAFEKIRSETPS